MGGVGTSKSNLKLTTIFLYQCFSYCHFILNRPISPSFSINKDAEQKVKSFSGQFTNNAIMCMCSMYMYKTDFDFFFFVRFYPLERANANVFSIKNLLKLKAFNVETS